MQQYSQKWITISRVKYCKSQWIKWWICTKEREEETCTISVRDLMGRDNVGNVSTDRRIILK
jgi:hypothetical protein